MTTNNIVSTPNITGNIGSCTTQVETQIVKSGMWSEEGYTIATNSCTGEVKQYDYYALDGFSIFFAVFLVMAFLLILVGIMSDNY